MLSRFGLGGLAASFALTACTSSVPPLAYPDRVEAVCVGEQVPHQTSILSIVASTDDKLVAVETNTAAVHQMVHAAGGVIAYWHDLELLLPKTAAQLGESGKFVHVAEVGIALAPEGAKFRTIALRVRDHGAERWIELHAYDVANPCVEGKRQS